MPIYEYQCRECGHDLEVIQKISEPNLTDCPLCEKPALKKLISRVSFRLKGTGWYETDFKNKPSSPDQNGESSSKETQESKDSDQSTETNQSSDSSSSETKSTTESSKTTETQSQSAQTA